MAVNEKIKVRVYGYDHKLVEVACKKIVDAAKRHEVKVSGPIPLPTDKEIVTILRAVHKYKDSREQFEQRTHKRLIVLLKPTAELKSAILSLELPAGVGIKLDETK
ncbi:MAG: 30S ribosomal protein S10 [Clostridia bacterium]|nr:30S ribosomal protein S10 [Clostridia bacterium]